MADRFSRTLDTADFPPRKAWSVTPSDSADLADVAVALWVGGAGALVVTLADDADGTSVTLSAVPAGSYLKLRVKRVWSTGTAATGIVAFT